MQKKYQVLGYTFDTFEEARTMAKVKSEGIGKPIALMEKLDSMTPWHVLIMVDYEKGYYVD